MPSLLFSGTVLGPLKLQNRLVMSPLTRSRAINNIPNALMTQYYAQRASVGLIITEGTSPSPNGLGYPRIPGIFSAAQVAGWKSITDAVHAKGAKMFMQLMHCGRIVHPLNMPAGARALAPSAIAAAGEMYTDAEGPKPHPVPQAMSDADIKNTINEFVEAAQNAMKAGFDGIELHGANGYLLEQFIRPTSNQRTDAYGGSIANRARFVLAVTEAVIAAIGKDKVGIRLSPFGVFNDMPLYDTMEADYRYLAQQLNARELLYIHLVDHSSMGAPPVPDAMKATFRQEFKRALILSGGYEAERAERDLAAGKCDLVAFGRPILANPDLITRWKTDAALNVPDMTTFYTPGPKGYTDYPSLAEENRWWRTG
ncbi:MAG: alkene reductase [Gammaproteobacteria bacterium]|nr:alkene reductase [Gammaproteobacteria bacterium]